MKGWKVKVTLVLLSVIFSLGIAEFAFRKILFGKKPRWENLRKAESYASTQTNEYWKLDYLFHNSQYPPPKNPHPVLDWIGYFQSTSLIHWDYIKLHKRRPVLLFGDSFAQCMKQSKCFEEILNADSAFGKQHYLLNYGVGGYGLDQIYLLMREAIPHYEKPFVVFTFLTMDLDRDILEVRTGRKPWFEREGDSLLLKGVPISANADSFFVNNPPGIYSYLWRKFLFSNVNFFPGFLEKRLKGEEAIKEKIKYVSELIVRDAIRMLRESGVDFTVLVFETEDQVTAENHEANWRIPFIRETFSKYKVPFVWSGALLHADTAFSNERVAEYFIPGDGHPTTAQNLLIASEIKRQVLENSTKPYVMQDTLNPVFYEVQIRNYEKQILANPGELQHVHEGVAKNNLSFDEMLRKHAIYLFDLDRELQ